MNSETYIDFCFMRNGLGNFAPEINVLLKDIFRGVRVNWYLEEKSAEGADIVIAEVKGMSRWESEAEVINYLENQGGDAFWEYLQGYKMYIYPAKRGCNSCGSH